MTTRTHAILQEIGAERGKQDQKWGEQNHEDPMWSAILGEEFGEACQALLHNDKANLREELVQIAAVATAWIECLDRNATSQS